MPVLESLSANLQRALDNNSANRYFTELEMSNVEPGANSTLNPFDIGVFDIGYGGAKSCQQILVLPYAYGEPGAEFWMRVYGWRLFGSKSADWIWIPTLLAELACMTSTRSGPPREPGQTSLLIREKEYVCDAIVPTAGVPGIVAPGRGLIAWFTVPTLGCQKVQFDFMIGDEGPGFPNALWARA